MKILLGISALFTLTPLVAEAAPQTFADLVSRLIVIIDFLIPLLVGLALVIYLFSIGQNLFKAGDAKQRNDMIQNVYTWGIIVLFVMVSIWGILKIMQNTFFSSEGSAGSYFDAGGGDNYYDCGFGECE